MKEMYKNNMRGLQRTEVEERWKIVRKSKTLINRGKGRRKQVKERKDIQAKTTKIEKVT